MSGQEIFYCKNCRAKCWISTIRRHLTSNPGCKTKYSGRELGILDEKFLLHEKSKRCSSQKSKRNVNNSKRTNDGNKEVSADRHFTFELEQIAYFR